MTVCEVGYGSGGHHVPNEVLMSGEVGGQEPVDVWEELAAQCSPVINSQCTSCKHELAADQLPGPSSNLAVSSGM